MGYLKKKSKPNYYLIKKREKAMKIKEILSQHRRDFTAIYVCEGCGREEKSRGYDDSNFHDNVIPKMKCESCGESSISLGVDYRQLTTKYPDGFQI